MHMVDNFLSLLFIIFVILMITDFITTEYVLKKGGYEKSQLLKFVAGRPFAHAFVKIIEIIIVFLIMISISNFFTDTFLPELVTLILLLLNIGLVYAQINNLRVIFSMT